MIINWFFYWLVFAVGFSVVFCLLKRKLLGRYWGVLLLIWSPLIVLLFFVALFVLGEYLRSVQMKKYALPKHVENVLSERGRTDFRELLEGREEEICFFYSYDLTRQAYKEAPERAKYIDDFILPEDDGRWYAIFFSKEGVSRIYYFYSDGFNSGCQHRVK